MNKKPINVVDNDILPQLQGTGVTAGTHEGFFSRVMLQGHAPGSFVCIDDFLGKLLAACEQIFTPRNAPYRGQIEQTC